MRKISDIYKEYKIMPQLQLHQLRVAAVAKQICDSIDIPVATHSVIIACLLHDMANIVKFNLDYTQREFPEFFGDHDYGYWSEVKNEFIEKYGEDDHEATRKLVHDMDLSDEVLRLLDKCLDHSAKENIGSFDLASSICKYADTRLSPHGVMPLRARLEEWQRRDDKVTLEYMEMTYSLFHSVEKKIFEHSSITPDAINDASIVKIVEELKNFEL